MRTIDPATFDKISFNRILTGVVAPRPIAFASTVDGKGLVNLSPFSFFNVFSYIPPVLIFSVSRRMRNQTVKHTLENVQEVPEVVINMVNYSMVEQMSLTSADYDKGINEFVKGGFTAVPSQKVRPPRVKESLAAFECRVNQIVSLGENAGAGNLVICEVVLAHFSEDLFDDQGDIDPVRLDAAARLGGNWYCRVDRNAIFEITKPGRHLGMGVDLLPEPIRNSAILNGNNLGRLAGLEALPGTEELDSIKQDRKVQQLLTSNAPEEQWHLLAKKWLEAGEIGKAMAVLLVSLQARTPAP